MYKDKDTVSNFAIALCDLYGFYLLRYRTKQLFCMLKFRFRLVFQCVCHESAAFSIVLVLSGRRLSK
jgi:hypothetical protein